MIKARIRVSLKKGVLDPQGQAVRNSLKGLGYDVDDIRIGKYVEVSIDGDDVGKAHDTVKAMCEKLLVNPIIEEYSYDLEVSR
ncbi:MAG: phosphoribosylformylglycinamidine synthase subunit PurS [Thermoanaerobacteraceae bacterium]|nr:phosphoribosylformylglycinamidine synthase subunit PurS [Thermoanaerobacteraceae bacterium]